MLKAELEVVVDSLVGHLAQQGKIGHTNFLLLGALESGLLDLRLSPGLSSIANVGLSLGAAEATAPLLTTAGTSGLTLKRTEKKVRIGGITFGRLSVTHRSPSFIHTRCCAQMSQPNLTYQFHAGISWAHGAAGEITRVMLRLGQGLTKVSFQGISGCINSTGQLTQRKV